MMAGQCAMILAPIAMGQISKVGPSIPFYTTVCGGTIVILSMLFILSRPGGKKAGRVTKEEWDKMVKEEKKGSSDNETELAVVSKWRVCYKQCKRP